MRIAEMNWMQVEDYLKTDDRCVLPLGSTEQHAYLSLSVDNILAEQVALQAAEPLNIPVFPVVNYGITYYFRAYPGSITYYFRAYPGSITLRTETYLRMVRDILDSIAESGFKRILIVNGHGGNSVAATLAGEWMADNPTVKVKFHNWWNAPQTMAQVQKIDPQASHASWMENFPWTRLEGVSMPDAQKPMIDFDAMRLLPPKDLRTYLGDGNFGGFYQRSDEDMQSIWEVALEETRALLTGAWGLE